LNAFVPLPAQHWTQTSIGADQEEGQCHFGWVVAARDFNQDGYDDLAIGAPNENVGSAVDAGEVIVLYGSSVGLSATAATDGTGRQFQEWNQDSGTVVGLCEDYDHFGAALTSGDFNNDGYDDLAVGVPNEDIESGGVVTVTDAGAVNVLYGSSEGLKDIPAPDGTGNFNDWWWQDSASITGIGEDFDFFGFSLAAGDFNRDGYDDLAVGAPSEDVEVGGVVSVPDAGAVNLILGSASGLTATGNQWWWQDSPNVDDSCEAQDYFGHSVAAGDFDGDGYPDLAIGAPGEDLGGAVNVIYGSSAGVRATPAADGTGNNDQLWDQNKPNVLDTAEANDAFGWSLAAADFNGDGKDDLSVGVASEDIVRAGVNYVDAGAANVLYGSSDGVRATPAADGTGSSNQFWHQDRPSVLDVVESNDSFGECVYGP
jgi:hypothetical protein